MPEPGGDGRCGGRGGCRRSVGAGRQCSFRRLWARGGPLGGLVGGSGGVRGPVVGLAGESEHGETVKVHGGGEQSEVG